MRRSVFLGLVGIVLVGVMLAVTAAFPIADRVLADRVVAGSPEPAPPTTSSTVPAGPRTTARPPVTINEFLPEDRSLGDCISAIPKPGCGSEARGGWRQSLVLISIVVGLALIAWRVVVASRRARSGVG